MKNLKAMLENQGTSFDKVIRSNLFILEMTDFAAVDAVYKSYFDPSKPYPAWACVAVHQLPRSARFEIVVDAIIE